MSRHLYFQHLPSHIIQRIVFYTEHASAHERIMFLNMEDVVKKNRNNMLALSHTCSHWREMVLGLMYYRCKLYPDAYYYLISSNRATTHSEFFNSMPNPKGIAHVRQLCIVTSMLGLATGDTHTYLQSTDLGELYFPSVTKLSIMVNPSSDNIPENTKTIEMMSSFVEYICSIVPNQIHMDIHGSGLCLVPNQKGYYSFVNHLTQCFADRAHRISLILYECYFIPCNTVHSYPTTLTYLSCHVGETRKEMFEFIRMNSQSLETLILHPMKDEYMLTQLITDSKGDHIKYPYLHKLQIEKGAASIISRESFPGIAPFPQLRDLLINGIYPFGDEVLFRDNAKTLKSLKLEYDDDTVSMFNTFISKNVFKLPCLQSLEIGAANQDVANSEQYKRNMIAFVREACSRVEHIWVDGVDIYKLAILNRKTDQDGKWGERIRELVHFDMDFELQQVIDLLKVFPNLERLTSGLAHQELLAESLEDTSYLDDIYKKYSQSFPKFRLWSVCSRDAIDIEYCAIYSIILALACSGFHGVRLSSLDALEYRETLRILTALYPYKKYTWLAKRLLPGLHARRGPTGKKSIK